MHGFADSGDMYLPLAATELTDHFEIIAIDLPGFGVSPRNSAVNTIEDFAKTIAALASLISPDKPIGLVGHSIASAIAIAMVNALAVAPIGVFSIEGTLTAADAYFSGKAVNWDSPHEFKEAFSNEIWRASEQNVDLRRYFGGVIVANADAMWQLGRDAHRVSEHNAVGRAYQSVSVPSLYYWGAATTPPSTQLFIKNNALNNRQYDVNSHWPTVTSPAQTAIAIAEFFDKVG